MKPSVWAVSAGMGVIADTSGDILLGDGERDRLGVCRNRCSPDGGVLGGFTNEPLLMLLEREIVRERAGDESLFCSNLSSRDLTRWDNSAITLKSS